LRSAFKENMPNPFAHKKSIGRLTCYRRTLLRLQNLGFEKVFSETLSEEVGVTSSQVRKDFSLFMIKGNKKGGYQVDTLLKQLNQILKKDQIHKVILVGMGNIGNAILKYRAFEVEGIEIVAGFDIDPSKVNSKKKVPIYKMDDLESCINEKNIQIGIIAVPVMAAQQVYDKMIQAGIKGILNFAPIKLKGGEHTIIENVNITQKLENVIYFVDDIS